MGEEGSREASTSRVQTLATVRFESAPTSAQSSAMSAVLVLQRDAGNRATSAWLATGARLGGSGAVATPLEDNSRLGAIARVQRQLTEPPTKLVTSEVEESSFPKDNEATLDKRIKSRQEASAPSGKGKYIGTVSYIGLPGGKDKVAIDHSLERRAAKHALLEAIITDIEKKNGIEIRLRVPLEDSPVVADYAMVILRFDRQRNVEVEYAGNDSQAKGSLTDPTMILGKLGRDFEVTFVSDGIKAKMPGDKKVSTFSGKLWSSDDATLLNDALPLIGATERGVMKGCKIRRLNAKTAGTAAGFFSTGDNSINLADAALPFDKAIWVGEGGKFFTRGVHTVLHEIGHALHSAPAPAGTAKKGNKGLDLFRAAVLAESRKRTKKAPGGKFPPPGIIPPTDYAATSWHEFYADTYSIYITNPSFLKTAQAQYLYDFFRQYFP